MPWSWIRTVMSRSPIDTDTSMVSRCCRALVVTNSPTISAACSTATVGNPAPAQVLRTSLFARRGAEPAGHRLRPAWPTGARRDHRGRHGPASAVFTLTGDAGRAVRVSGWAKSLGSGPIGRSASIRHVAPAGRVVTPVQRSRISARISGSPRGGGERDVAGMGARCPIEYVVQQQAARPRRLVSTGNLPPDAHVIAILRGNEFGVRPRRDAAVRVHFGMREDRGLHRALQSGNPTRGVVRADDRLHGTVSMARTRGLVDTGRAER